MDCHLGHACRWTSCRLLYVFNLFLSYTTIIYRLAGDPIFCCGIYCIRPVHNNFLCLGNVTRALWHTIGNMLVTGGSAVVLRIDMGISPMVESDKPSSKMCRLYYDSQLFRLGNLLPTVHFFSEMTP